MREIPSDTCDVIRKVRYQARRHAPTVPPSPARAACPPSPAHLLPATAHPPAPSRPPLSCCVLPGMPCTCRAESTRAPRRAFTRPAARLPRALSPAPARALPHAPVRPLTCPLTCSFPAYPLVRARPSHPKPHHFLSFSPFFSSPLNSDIARHSTLGMWECERRERGSLKLQTSQLSSMITS